MIIGVRHFDKYWGGCLIRGRKNSLRGIKIVELRPCVTPQILAWAWVQFKSIKKKKKWQWNWLKVRCCKSGGVWLLGKSWKSLLLRLPPEYLIIRFSLTLKETSSLVNTNLDYCLKKKEEIKRNHQIASKKDQNSKKSEFKSEVLERKKNHSWLGIKDERQRAVEVPKNTLGPQCVPLCVLPLLNIFG